MPKGVPNKRYTPEFKKQVAETMHREKLSIREVSMQFKIGGHNVYSGDIVTYTLSDTVMK